MYGTALQLQQGMIDMLRERLNLQSSTTNDQHKLIKGLADVVQGNQRRIKQLEDAVLKLYLANPHITPEAREVIKEALR